MKKYDELILKILIDKYESSSLYDRSNKRTVKIYQKIDRNNFPEYFDESSMEYRKLHTQLEAAEEKELVILHWKNRKQGGILEKCELNTDKLESVYRYLQRKPKQEKITNTIQVCEELLKNENNNKLTNEYIKHIIGRLEGNKPLQQYLNIDDIEAFERSVSLLNLVLNNKEECFIREFSVKNLMDSKSAEKEISHTCSIIRKFSQDEYLQGLNDEELLREFGIFRNPVYIHIKGYGKFSLDGTSVKLDCFDDGVGISGSDAEKIKWNSLVVPEMIITVENLTAFHQFKIRSFDKKILCIYLGGYHNLVLKNFISHVYMTFPEAGYYHFGDIDCGGFLIWKNLIRKTGIQFKTLFMDELTYLSCADKGKELTEYDKKTLARMIEDSFFNNQKALLELMLEKGVKTEQEAVDINDMLNKYDAHYV